MYSQLLRDNQDKKEKQVEERMKAKSNILIISDMCGYGKVSAAVQMPILSYMGLDVFNLPTMLISNTFPYGKYAILE